MSLKSACQRLLLCVARICASARSFWAGDKVVEFSLVEDLVDGCLAYGCGVVVAEVSFYAAWSPIPRPSELKYEVHGGLWDSMDRAGFVERGGEERKKRRLRRKRPSSHEPLTSIES